MMARFLKFKERRSLSWCLYSTMKVLGKAEGITTSSTSNLQPEQTSMMASRTLSTIRPSKYWTCMPYAGRKGGGVLSAALGLNSTYHAEESGIATTCTVILAVPFSTSSVLDLNSNYRREWKIQSTKLTPIKRHRRVILIDENGKNLGEMESKIALGLAEGHGLTVTEVKDSDLSGKYPVFKMISKRELSEDEKAKRALARQKKKEEQFKEFKLGTRISDHDLDIKMRNIRGALTSGITVRVSIEAKRRKGVSAELFEAELERRGVMLEDITKRLKDVATKMSKKPNKVKKEAVAAEYKPINSPAEGAGSKRSETGPEGTEVESENVKAETSLPIPQFVPEGGEAISPLTRDT